MNKVNICTSAYSLTQAGHVGQGLGLFGVNLKIEICYGQVIQDLYDVHVTETRRGKLMLLIPLAGCIWNNAVCIRSGITMQYGEYTNNCLVGTLMK